MAVSSGTLSRPFGNIWTMATRGFIPFEDPSAALNPLKSFYNRLTPTEVYSILELWRDAPTSLAI
jgi:hypothetical protein